MSFFRNCLVLLILCVFAFTFSVYADTSEEKKEPDVLLVSLDNNEAVAQKPSSDEVLFRNADPQLTVEWALANARTTVMLAGNYRIQDRIDIPRDDVTLIIDQKAVLGLATDAKCTSPEPGFRGRDGRRYPIRVLVYNKLRQGVRVYYFGEVAKDQNPIMPVIYDGRRKEGGIGIHCGEFITTSPYMRHQCFFVDVRMDIPLFARQAGNESPITIEGGVYCRVGFAAALAAEPGGKTGEVVDLNSNNFDTHIDTVVGERSYEIVDSNASSTLVKNMISIGKPQKLLSCTYHSGPRLTTRPLYAQDRVALNVESIQVFDKVKDVKLRNEIPKFPEALPEFTIKTTIEMTMEDGSKEEIKRDTKVDVSKLLWYKGRKM